MYGLRRRPPLNAAVAGSASVQGDGQARLQGDRARGRARAAVAEDPRDLWPGDDVRLAVGREQTERVRSGREEEVLRVEHRAA